MRRAACLFLLLIAALRVGAQPPADKNTRQPRILLLVDASSSMLQPWSGKSTRFQTAGNIIGALMDSIYTVNAGVEFALRVYGHQSPAQNNDCYDTKQEVMFSKNNVTQMGLRLASLKPYGVSPIAYSLKEAANNDLTDEARNAYSIILITDGAESCGGNICDVVKSLIERKIYFKPYIISLVDYAPLRDQYSCLGSFLQVAKPEDIPTAIRTIVEDYRPLLSMPIMAVKLDETPQRPIIKPRPDTLRVVVPAWIPERSNLPDLTISIQRTLPSPGNTKPQLKIVSAAPVAEVSKPPREYMLVSPLATSVPRREFQTQFYRPLLHSMAISRPSPVSKPEPEPLKQEFIAGMLPTAGHYLNIRESKTPAINRRKGEIVASVAKPEWEKPAPEGLIALNAAPRHSIPARTWSAPESLSSYAYIISAVVKPDLTPRDTVKAVKITPPPVKADTPRTTISIRKLDPVVKPAPTNPTVAAAAGKPREMTFEKATEDASETSLSILFTDGRGKFFASSPLLQLLDATTGKEVKKFHRTVDAAGNPDPQIVPPGNYNLLIAGRANMLMRRVTVEANKKNKVTIKVANGSLRFRYEDAPERPVTEFEAIVNIRFEPGPTIRQRCTAELDYAPGNYYIEINTMPISRFNVDIDFGATTEIQIPQPGYVQFTNQTPKGRVRLFAPLGNKFVPFTELSITGSPAAQKLQLKPGAYEAHWYKNPGVPYATETIEHFNVQTNSITEVELR